MAIQEVKVVRDRQGMWTHPELPEWDEAVPALEIQQWFNDNQGTSGILTMEDDASFQLVEDWFNGITDDCSDWQPTWSKSESSFLLSIHDTEDGPVALFFIPDTAVHHHPARAVLNSSTSK